jgi:hypothetical protein
MVKEVFRRDNFEIAFNDASTTGYIVECGAGAGKSLKTLVALAQPNQLVFGFDSFEGLPEDWKMNEEHTWPAGSFAFDEIPDMPGVELRIGWFADTLPIWKKEHPGRIALLHIDADLYSSCVTVLEELNDQIHIGTIVVSDDHFYKPAHGTSHEYTLWKQGQYRAFEEWLEKYDRKAHLLSRGTIGQATYRIIQ